MSDDCQDLRRTSQMDEQQNEQRRQWMRMLVDSALQAKALGLWDEGAIASAMLVAHIKFARTFLADQDIASSLRVVADNLDAAPTPPELEPELRR